MSADQHPSDRRTALSPRPVEAIEPRVAVRAVAMDAHAADALRQATLATADPIRVRQCRAEAGSIARQWNAVLTKLLRMQATREKQEGDMRPSSMERDGRVGQGVTAAEPDHSAPPPETAPVPPADAAPATAAAEIAAEAERYAVICPDRAARIRAADGLPAYLDIGPPQLEIVAALLCAGQHATVSSDGTASHGAGQ